jgi:hypothetical protein
MTNHMGQTNSSDPLRNAQVDGLAWLWLLSWAGSLAAGVILIIWITVQIQWVPVGFVHILYLSWGVLLLLMTLHPNVRKYCNRNLR